MTTQPIFDPDFADNKPFPRDDGMESKLTVTVKPAAAIGGFDHEQLAEATRPLGCRPKGSRFIATTTDQVLGQQRLTHLPDSFTPGPYDVICARGHKVKNHSGNQLFRSKIEQNVKQYSLADSKVAKGVVVTEIIDFFREYGGDFVKQVNGVWFAVGDKLAREKCGQAFREILCHRYRSSTKAKRKRWKQEEEMVMETSNQNIQAAQLGRFPSPPRQRIAGNCRSPTGFKLQPEESIVQKRSQQSASQECRRGDGSSTNNLLFQDLLWSPSDPLLLENVEFDDMTPV